MAQESADMNVSFSTYAELVVECINTQSYIVLASNK